MRERSCWLAVGFYLQDKPADEIKTYGYHRAGVLSAFVNALTLIALSGVDFLRERAAAPPSRAGAGRHHDRGRARSAWR